MAVANTKSNVVTRLDATPPKTVSVHHQGGRVYHAKQSLEVAAADDDTSVYRFFRVHSSWSVLSLKVFCDAITGGTDYNFGLYDTAANGGADVDENLFADAVDLSSAIVAGSELVHEILNIDNEGERIWELLGLTEDPDKFYDLCATGITVGTAAGTIALQMLYGTGS